MFQTHSTFVEQRDDYKVIHFRSLDTIRDYSLFEPWDWFQAAVIRAFLSSDPLVLIGSMNLDQRDEVHSVYRREFGRCGDHVHLNYCDGFRISAIEWSGLLLDKLPSIDSDCLLQLVGNTTFCLMSRDKSVGGPSVVSSLVDLELTPRQIEDSLMLEFRSIYCPTDDGLGLRLLMTDEELRNGDYWALFGESRGAFSALGQ